MLIKVSLYPSSILKFEATMYNQPADLNYQQTIMHITKYNIIYVSLSTVVLNSRDCYGNVWLPKICTLKTLLKIRTCKTNYNSIGTTLTTL